MLGQHCFKHWSSTQAIIALSSGEAEYYGVVKASSVGLGIQSMFRDMGHDMSLIVHTDAEAAKGIASRTGLGKTRHIDVHYLWVQEQIKNNKMILRKVWGADNPADLLTKYLDSTRIVNLMNKLGCFYKSGRADEAPSI